LLLRLLQLGLHADRLELFGLLFRTGSGWPGSLCHSLTLARLIVLQGHYVLGDRALLIYSLLRLEHVVSVSAVVKGLDRCDLFEEGV
jgi:hypothetical protein